MWRTVLAGILIGCLCASSASMTVNHSGGTDEDACHTNHDTGNYHCHNSSSSSSSGSDDGDTTTALAILGVGVVFSALIFWGILEALKPNNLLGEVAAIKSRAPL